MSKKHTLIEFLLENARRPLSLEDLYDTYDWVVGVDEAGWGPIAGPLSAAAVVLDTNTPYPNYIKDSKKLSDSRRKEAYYWIKKNAVYVDYVEVPAAVFSSLGAARARELAFCALLDNANKASEAEHKSVYHLLDGSYAPRGYKGQLTTIVKGDSRVVEISAASIVAKVLRDATMLTLDQSYPEFKWHANKGYATKDHLEALRVHGATPLHRQNVKKVKDAGIYGYEAAE